MILEIALGIILAVVLLWLLPLIITAGVWLILIGLLFGGIAIVGYLLFVYPEASSGFLVIGGVLLFFLFVLGAMKNIPDAIRNSGGFRLWVKSGYLRIRSTFAFTIKQKAALELEQTKHSEQVYHTVQERKDQQAKKFHKKLENVLIKAVRRFRSHDNVVVSQKEKSIEVVVNSHQGGDQHHLRCHLWVKMNYPQSAVPVYKLQELDQNNNLKPAESFNRPADIQAALKRRLKTALLNLEKEVQSASKFA